MLGLGQVTPAASRSDRAKNALAALAWVYQGLVSQGDSARASLVLLVFQRLWNDTLSVFRPADAQALIPLTVDGLYGRHTGISMAYVLWVTAPRGSPLDTAISTDTPLTFPPTIGAIPAWYAANLAGLHNSMRDLADDLLASLEAGPIQDANSIATSWSHAVLDGVVFNQPPSSTPVSVFHDLDPDAVFDAQSASRVPPGTAVTNNRPPTPGIIQIADQPLITGVPLQRRQQSVWPWVVGVGVALLFGAGVAYHLKRKRRR